MRNAAEAALDQLPEDPEDNPNLDWCALCEVKVAENGADVCDFCAEEWGT